MSVSTIPRPPKTVYELPSATSKTFTVSNDYRGIMTFLDSNTDKMGMYFLRSAANGAVVALAIKAVSSSHITLDAATANRLTINQLTVGSPLVVFETVQGSIT